MVRFVPLVVDLPAPPARLENGSEWPAVSKMAAKLNCEGGGWSVGLIRHYFSGMKQSLAETWARKVGGWGKQTIPPKVWHLLKEAAARFVYAGNLRVLARIYGSDKWGSHWYAQHYERHLGARRKRKIVLLELGIGGYDNPRGGGASLRMWQKYFPRGRIHGVDIHDKRVHDDTRIKTFVGDQSDERFLRQVIAEIGPPDIIIDDGSHVNAHVLNSFEVLFPLLAEDGIYVVEDVCTSYWPDHGGSSTDLNAATTSMGMFKALVDGLNHKEFVGRVRKPTYCDENIVALHFYHNLVFCHKGKNAEQGTLNA
ncbi:MAG: class I SAM-dependent methyltransferase [Opitutaceae bacterium]|nr:class I SAM-dependent methyltransferase [Opitutaceae bacterium]